MAHQQPYGYQQPGYGQPAPYGYGAPPPAGYGHPPPGHQQQQQTTIVLNQPQNSNANHGQQQNVTNWSSGICGCCEDCGSCCFAFWCYPCFLCSLATTMDECALGPCCCGTSCMGSGGQMPNLFLIGMRAKLRAQYGIKGSVCQDICCLCCCEFCATTQMMRQLKHYGRK